MEFDLNAIEEEDSLYVSNIDDPDMPARGTDHQDVDHRVALAHGQRVRYTVFVLFGILTYHIMGNFLAFILPITTYRFSVPSLPSSLLSSSFCSALPLPLLRLIRPLTIPRAIEFSFNPGPWSIKEHAVVYIMANVTTSSSYALNAVMTSQVFCRLHINHWFSLVLVLATQLTGFGLAGLCRRFLV